ncbi:MAG: phosphoribosylaminoimidazolesuccinocarboxamide synthase [Acidobacteria bacterium]|nr:phosphoribosylaminoimidazolesuccinocarboxamide synthase [Acidobacteriota bacterium]
MQTVLTSLEMPGLSKVASGKVREIFDLGDAYLFVATDRISSFDCVLPQGIPDKGRILTQLTAFWFDLFGAHPPNHLISMDLTRLPESAQPFREQLEGRSMIVTKLKMFPVECVVRGFLVGSGYKEYKRDGRVCGIKLPEGLTMASRLPEPIFTPATKATDGHDINIPFSEMERIVGQDLSRRLKDISLDLYSRAYQHAWERGVIIADTKFEFGLLDGEIVLADEVLTPDSSRYWPLSEYQEGISPPSFDKQYVRDYLESLDWDKNPPAPNLPETIIQGTAKRYRECLDLLTDGSVKL